MKTIILAALTSFVALTERQLVRAAISAEAEIGYEVLHSDGDFKVLIEPSERAKLSESKPVKGDKVQVHYEGKFDHDGDEFDSSIKRNKPFTFEMQSNRVIKCWDEAFAHLSKGVKARLLCPPEYAYG